MKKILIIALAALMLLASGAYATRTRVLTMGENNNIMLDDANVLLYPSRMTMYPNVAAAEFSSGDVTSLGVHWKFNEKKPCVIGTYFTNGISERPGSYTGSTFGRFYDYYGYFEEFYNQQVSGDRRIDLIYGRKLGTTNFGFGLTYVNAGNESHNSLGILEQSYSRFGFTFGLTPDNGNWDVAASVSLGSWKQDFDDTTMSAGYRYVFSSKPDGYSDIAVRGRYFAKMNPTVTLVPHVDLAFGRHAETQIRKISDTGILRRFVTTWGEESKLFSFGAGCGLNYSPVTNVLAVLDFGLNSSTIKENSNWLDVMTNSADSVLDRDTSSSQWKETSTILPYWKLGVEGAVFPWMDIRFGATSNWSRYNYEYNANGNFNDYLNKNNYVSGQTYFGAGLHFGNLHIDTHMDPQIVLHGFDFITGVNYDENDAPDNLNFQVSMLYMFK